jgi:hypothetical protein
MIKKQVMLAGLGILILWGNQKTFSLTVLDPAYQAETYATYDYAPAWPTLDMTFGPNGNLYTTHHHEYTSGQTDGWIYRIMPDKTVEPWITGISRPEDIIWGGGTSFGDYLYFTEGFDNIYNSDGGLTRISLDGTIDRFVTSGFDQPVTLGIDQVGNFGGDIFVGSGDSDRINRVLPNGQVQGFYSFGTSSGSSIDIEFAPNGSYGGLMYVGTQFTSLTNLSGILTFDTGGNPTKIAPEIIGAFDLAFDTTDDQLFGGYLYASGRLAGDPSWTSRIFRIYPDGTSEEIITATSWRARMAFGADGLYINESYWDVPTITISRVVPEPAMMSLLGLGMLGLYRRRREKHQ